jgi:hypothetical protein
MAYSGPLQLVFLAQEAAAAPPHPWQRVLFGPEEHGPHFHLLPRQENRQQVLAL